MIQTIKMEHWFDAERVEIFKVASKMAASEAPKSYLTGPTNSIKSNLILTFYVCLEV